jgi:hypothetical protein
MPTAVRELKQHKAEAVSNVYRCAVMNVEELGHL